MDKNIIERYKKAKDLLNTIDLLLYVKLNDEQRKEIFDLFQQELPVFQAILLEIKNNPQSTEEKIRTFLKDNLTSYTIFKNKLCKKEIELLDSLSESS